MSNTQRTLNLHRRVRSYLESSQTTVGRLARKLGLESYQFENWLFRGLAEPDIESVVAEWLNEEGIYSYTYELSGFGGGYAG